MIQTGCVYVSVRIQGDSKLQAGKTVTGLCKWEKARQFLEGRSVGLF